MNWKPGRLNAKYQVLTICNFGFFDINLIKIPTHTRIPYHIDHIPRRKHYRLNIDLIKPKIGGQFIGKHIFKLPRIIFFKSDHIHALSEIEKGHALILSIGFAIAK
jgi:hypothetical protein